MPSKSQSENTFSIVSSAESLKYKLIIFFCVLIAYYSLTYLILTPLMAYSADISENKNEIRGKVALYSQTLNFINEQWSGLDTEKKWVILGTGHFNNDNYSDLLLGDTQTNFVYTAKSSGRGSFTAKPWRSFGVKLNQIRFLPGDRNGDGCTDIFVYLARNKSWFLALSNCAEDFVYQELNIFSKNTNPSTIVIGDFDGDELSDIATESEHQPGTLTIAFSNHDDNFDQRTITNSSSEGEKLSAVGNNTALNKLLFIKKHKLTNTWYTRLLNTRDSFSNMKIYSSFPKDSNFELMGTGNFNGDEFPDLLVLGNKLSGWWAALGNGSTSIEKPILPPFPNLVQQQIKNLNVGDFDGNGLDDLITLNSNNNELLLALGRFANNIANIQLINSTGEYVYTDQNGDFSIPLVNFIPYKHPPKLTLTPISTLYAFNPTQFTLKKRQQLHRTITFMGTDITTKGRAVGKALDIGFNHPGPYICLGYTSSSKWLSNGDFCDHGYAYLGVNVSRDNLLNSRTIRTFGNCCRLPADDILTEEHKIVRESCPKDHVVTGSIINWKLGDAPQYLRCTKINSLRYQLAELKPGRYWGYGSYMRHQRERLKKSDLPLAIQYGIGRTSYSTWDTHGCVGYPWGSLMVSRNGGYCPDVGFSQLQYKGYLTDPALGTPVKMFPDCQKIENVFDPTSGCFSN